MSIHEYDNNMKSDEEFIIGDISFLVEGNCCRLLDGRRTTGIIEKYFEDSAMFRWRITKYEDSGKYWDLPAENIKSFQFERSSNRLSKRNVKEINELIKKYENEIIIKANSKDRYDAEREIERAKESAKQWMEVNSLFLKDEGKIDFSSCEGSKLLAKDLIGYMESIGMAEEERKTAEIMVLNPNSGEWIKGMSIILAEMGLVSYHGKGPRTKDIFKGLGEKENRRKYLINRLAFIRAYFSILDIKEIVLYRGMSSEKQWKRIHRTYLPCTFNLEVAKAFSDFDRESKYKVSYLVKMSCSVEKLFMTYLETDSMNRQYKESEALLLYDSRIEL
ncbi:hypothetical protein R9X47_20750 [Wukongibacter baidiensis]|uniref:hypothetical protein n=1 Tax=Wukongibacter baidiensis TaxID=1723361 RepID=UPI003D7FEDD5